MPSDGATPRPLRVGDKIAGKLRLVRRVGHGGMGTVWAARNEATDASVALKVLRPDKDASAEAIARFRHEAKLGAMLAHRSITRVYDLIEEPDGSLVLVMELLRGETLDAYYKSKGSLTNEETVAILVPVLSALQHAHEHGVVHRDIKPQNIFLHVDPDGQVTPKLLDFGIAKAPDTNFQTLYGRVLGTPAYMSPEQIRASGELDGRSDLFGVGVVAFEAIAGACPFDAAAPSAALAQVLEAPVDPDPKIDPRLWFEIQRAMSKQPYERHAKASELAAAFCAAVGKTEAELHASLRRSKPPPRIEDEPVETDTLEGTAPGETLGAGSHSISHAPPRRRSWISWAAAISITSTIAILVAGTLRGMGGAPASSVAPTAIPSATPSASAEARTPDPKPEPAADSKPEPTAATDPAPAAPKAGAQNGHAAPRPQAPPKKPPSAPSTKPIATTPGF